TNGSLTLTARGQHFVDGAVILFGNTALVTTWVSPTQLTASVPAALLVAGSSGNGSSNGNTIPVRVQNPSPAGGVSGPQPFTLTQPAPVLDSISPASVAADGLAKTLTLMGSNFMAPASIRVITAANSVGTEAAQQVPLGDYPATLTNTGSLQVTLPGNLFNQPGSLTLAVVTAAGVSNGRVLALQVAAPAPVLNYLSPSFVQADGRDKNLFLAGSNFIAPVSVLIAGENYPVTTVLPDGLNITLPGSLFTVPGELTLAVKALGGTSNPQTLYIDPPAPVLTAITPTSLIADGQMQTLTLTGDNFVEPLFLVIESYEQFISATVINGTTATVPLSISRGSSPGSLSVYLETSGGRSNSLDLQIVAPPPPPPPVAANIALGTLTFGKVTLTASAGAVTPGITVLILNERSGQTLYIDADNTGAFSATLDAAAGDILNIKTLTPQGEESASVSFTVATPPPLPIDVIPADPVTVAPPVDRSIITPIADSVTFLYTGPNAIQLGVAPGIIEARRVVVLRGKVTTRDGQPLAGATLTIQGHPEYGQTGTRLDGRFDLAANGGGNLTINYRKTGYLPVQRTINTPWQDFVMVEDVVMIPLDPQSTRIDLNAAAPMQMARATPVSDERGARQSTLLFPAGITATMVMPNGSTQTLTNLTVRSSEYTVGTNGPQAMPGPLPATSGYTYATELSVDEAIAVGAETVRFSQPVYHYVDNFLGFPVGGAVPQGYYDRSKAAWVPAPNGRVIGLLAVNNGLAELDINGSGIAADAVALAGLGITDAERQTLAGLYQPGQSFWRSPIDHFTPWDHNWPFAPPKDAVPPSLPDPKKPDINKPDCQSGSIIECQNQSLGETLPITNTPYSLNYKSSRTRGFGAYLVDIPISGSSVPMSLKRIFVSVSIAGQAYTYNYAPLPNQRLSFTWDGRDAYGREVQGARLATINVGYVYPLVYTEPTDVARSFARFGDTPISVNMQDKEVTLYQGTSVSLGTWQATAVGLGGWTLDAQHTYDPVGGVLHLGDGSSRIIGSRNTSTLNLLGSRPVFSLPFFDGISVNQTRILESPGGMVIDAQGNLYVSAAASNLVFKVTPDGLVYRVAGRISGISNVGFAGDGGLARDALLNTPTALAVDGQGNLYIGDYRNRRIRKVTPDGIISTVAGNGQPGFSGDDGPAIAAAIIDDRFTNDTSLPNGIDPGRLSLAVDAQGTLYIADAGTSRIRAVAPDGVIRTVAGGGTLPAIEGDGGLATAVKLGEIDAFGRLSSALRGFAIDSQGNLYFGQDNRIRSVSPSGIISTPFGGHNNPDRSNRASPYIDDANGLPAYYATLRGVNGLLIDREGNVYYSESRTFGFSFLPETIVGHRVRKIGVDGLLSTIAGNASPSTASTFANVIFPVSPFVNIEPSLMAIDAAGGLYIKSHNQFVLKVTPFQKRIAGDFAIAAEDGATVYQFDARGRHLSTRSTLTGAELRRFGYGPTGTLTSITDGDGNVTRIERNGVGEATAIVSPDGQRTILSQDGLGYLSSVTNPAGESIRMSYTASGLLTAYTNPRGQASLISYDANGRLTRDQNAAGGAWNLSRSGGNSDYTVSMSTALGRQTRYRVEIVGNGDTRRSTTQPDGSVSVTLEKVDGSVQTTFANGMVSSSSSQLDPRFGQQAPYTRAASLRMPSGLTLNSSASRSVALSNPTDLLSLTDQTDSITVNGKTSSTQFEAALKRLTSTSAMGRQSVTQ
ncbi:MAG: hypothetical protein JNM52_02155, partial [Betaproteobacteria bacterium]|nr:hypothetical protein [Betaproteobacteria bacterium]